MANEGPSLTKATYDKKRSRKPVPSSAQRHAELEEKKRDAAKSRRLHKLSHTDTRAFLREIGFDVAPKLPEPPIKRRKF